MKRSSEASEEGQPARLRPKRIATSERRTSSPADPLAKLAGTKVAYLSLSLSLFYSHLFTPINYSRYSAAYLENVVYNIQHKIFNFCRLSRTCGELATTWSGRGLGSARSSQFCTASVGSKLTNVVIIYDPCLFFNSWLYIVLKVRYVFLKK